MTKIVQLALALLLCAVFAQAQQTITYDFEDGLMPSDFTLFNVDMLTPADEGDIEWKDTAWIVIPSNTFEGFAALSISWYEDENGNEVGPADDWMILPKFELGAGAELALAASAAIRQLGLGADLEALTRRTYAGIGLDIDVEAAFRAKNAANLTRRWGQPDQ